jgi:hypothetical protein
LASKTGQKNPVGAAYTCASKISRISYLLKIGMEALQKNSPLVDPDFGRAVPAPDFSQAVPAPDFSSSSASPGLQSGGAGFQTRENALSCNDGALALVRTPPQTGKSRLFPRPLSRAYRLHKNSCFVSGHGFSRAVPDLSNEGFNPCASFHVK